MLQPHLTTIAVLIAVLAAWFGVFDHALGAYLDGALARSFAIARTLNGTISLIQDADVSVSPVGIGLTVGPGELLDPLNDLPEQFSSLAFAALTALGIQKFALQLCASLPSNTI